MQLGDLEKKIQKFLVIFSYAVLALALLNALLALILGTSATEEYLSIVKSLQLMILMTLTLITLPANAGMFFRSLTFTATFDYVDTDPYLDKWLALDPTTPESPNFEAIGLQSVYFLHNMGMFVVALPGYVLAVLLSYLLRWSSCVNC